MSLVNMAPAVCALREVYVTLEKSITETRSSRVDRSARVTPRQERPLLELP